MFWVPPQKDYFFAVPWRGSFGHILTMQLEPPKSRTLLSTGLPPQMLARVLVHVRVILPRDGQIDQQIDQVIIGVRPSFPLGRLPAILPKSWQECSLGAKGEAL